MVRFGSYNLLDYGRNRPRGEEREALVRAVIEALDVDVLAVQELYAPTPETAAGRLVELAEQVGMTAYHEAPWVDEDDASWGKAAVGFGRHDLHVGLLWRPERVAVVPGTFRAYEGDMWHCLVKGVFVVRGGDGLGYRVQHASYHAGPFGTRGSNEQEAQRVVSALTRPDDHPPALVGGDWNSISADRLADGTYYDPDPFAHHPWHGNLIYQCQWDYEDGQRVRWRADRTSGDLLYSGGLVDAAAELHEATAATGGLPWQATTGHWHRKPNADPYEPRRIDIIRTTQDVAAALLDHEVISALAGVDPKIASDHLPVVVTYDPAAITDHSPVTDSPVQK